MIQRLQLRNWRAYDELDIELGPGATFVVASNGIGKTSLVLAAAWGVFGEVAGVIAADEIRGDADEASVTVSLRLPSGVSLSLTRTVDRRGKSAVLADVGGRTLSSQEELDDLYGQEFGAETRVLAQLTFMIHGGLHETQGEFELRDHLAGLFGVRPMFEAAASARAIAQQTASTLRKMKVVERKDARQKDELVADLDAAEGALREGSAAREAAVAASNEASDRLRAAQDWANYRKALADRSAKLAAYAEVAASLLGREIDPETVVDVLGEWEASESAAVAAIETEVAEARGRAAVIRESLSTLQGADVTCPTCLRPFAEHDAEEAAAEHARHLAELDAIIADGTERAAAQRGVLDSLKGILADIRSVATPVEPSIAEPAGSLDEITRAHEAARDELQFHDQDLAVKRATVASTRDALEAIEQDQELLTELEELYKLEAISTATAKTFEATAQRIVEQHIEPLVDEVSRRWKQTFGREGLQLSADGRITRKVGSRTLSFGALSGGERVWALLVARLLVAAASVRAPFIWLDEPLEHLDPRLRRIVAGTLAMASSRAGIRQVVVTTYESPIAQQLMDDVPAASLVYVTSAD